MHTSSVYVIEVVLRDYYPEDPHGRNHLCLLDCRLNEVFRNYLRVCKTVHVFSCVRASNNNRMQCEPKFGYN